MQNNKYALVKKILFIILLIILFAGPIYLIQKRGREPELKESSAYMEADHSGGNLLIFSVSETSASATRFKLRVSSYPDANGVPANIILTATNGSKLNLTLHRVDSPYECHDSHDDGDIRIGFETEWTGTSLDDYAPSNMEVLVVSSNGDVSTISKSIAHICTRLADDVGVVSTDSEVMFPVE